MRRFGGLVLGVPLLLLLLGTCAAASNYYRAVVDELRNHPQVVYDDHANLAPSLTVESPQGTVTITFDEAGQLRSLDIS